MPKSELTVTAGHVGTTLRLSIGGELDRASTDRVESTLDEALSGEVEHIVLDLEEVTFLDLGGIRTLLNAHTRAGERGLDLTVVRPSGTASRIFTLTRIGEVLHVTGAGQTGGLGQS
jgi:anti-anti-sigma factor